MHHSSNWLEGRQFGFCLGNLLLKVDGFTNEKILAMA